MICPLCGEMYVLRKPRRCWNCGWRLRRDPHRHSSPSEGLGCMGLLVLFVLVWLLAQIH
jgi:hypothetical protein